MNYLMCSDERIYKSQNSGIYCNGINFEHLCDTSGLSSRKSFSVPFFSKSCCVTMQTHAGCANQVWVNRTVCLQSVFGPGTVWMFIRL